MIRSRKQRCTQSTLTTCDASRQPCKQEYAEYVAETPVPDRFIGSLLLKQKVMTLGHMLSLEKLEGRTHDKPRKPEWLYKGLYFTGDCFSCANKIAYEFKGFKVKILCKNKCSYEPAQITSVSK